MKRLLPDNISSKIYISNEAKRYYEKNKELNNYPFKTQNDLEKKSRNFIPMYEGKIFDPTPNKTISILKKTENQIIKQLSKLNSNEKLLRNNSYLNQFNNNPINLSTDQKIIEEKIKSIGKDKNNYMIKLEELKNQINKLQYNQEKDLGIIENSKKTKLTKFIEDFKNKEKAKLIEQNLKKLQEESEKLQLLMKKDLEDKIKKKNDEINNKEKEEVEKRNELLKKIKDKDREYVEKRKKKNTEELLKIKEFINKKPEKNYLYKKQNDKYLKEEYKLIKLESIKRKEIMRHIDIKEFDEMRKNFDKIKFKKMKETNEKIKSIKESWSERYKLIPLYVNPLGKMVFEEDNKMKNEEQNKILQRKKLKQLQEKYKAPKPQKITIEKLIDKENEIKFLRRPKPNLIKSNSYSDIIRQKMIEKYKTLQNRREKNKQNELLPDEDYYLDEPQLSKKIIEHDKQYEKYNKINKSFEKDKDKKTNNKEKEKKEPVDYLKERRRINEINKEKKRNTGDLSNIGSGTNDIRKLIKDNGLNNKILKVAKCKLESIEEKKRQKNLLLKCSGGVANKPELGEEVCDLMIDSIQAKLSLIKELDKNADESINEERKDVNNYRRYSIQEHTEESNDDENEDEDN